MAFTLQQQQAIQARGGSILVSAAAGSGKTSVLTSRVLSILSDEEHPVRPDQLLVVTFTKAAAQEMKYRIMQGVTSARANDPQNHYLRRQQAMLGRAAICTIDSFCLQLVQENAPILGLGTGFTVADPLQVQPIKWQVLTQLIEEKYEEKDPIYIKLFGCFGNGKNDNRLEQEILKLYDFFQSIPNSEEWCCEKLEQIKSCRDHFGDSFLGKKLMDTCLAQVRGDMRVTQRFISQLKEERYKKLLDYVLVWQQNLQGLLNAFDLRDITAVQKAMYALSFPTIPRGKDLKDDPQKIQIHSYYEKVKGRLKKERETYFARTAQQHAEDMDYLYPLVEAFFELTQQFSKNFGQKKIEVGQLEFADLEQYALRLVSNRTPSGYEQSPEGEALAAHYAYVLVDECQDINGVQDALLHCISQNRSNLFFVGDVKQSIYRFRQADPTLFVQKKDMYTPYNQQDFPALITLDKNFRSCKGVIDSVNFLCSCVFSRDLGGVEYTKQEHLVYGDICNQPVDDTTEVMLVQMGEEFDSAVKADAAAVATRIKEMVDTGFEIWDKEEKRSVQYGDIAILLRNANTVAPVYLQAMDDLGIPAIGSDVKEFLTKKEISQVLSFLKVIDDPHRDVDVAAAMLSPMFGFSPDDLAQLPKRKKRESLYSVLLQSSDDRVQEFVYWVRYFQQLSGILSATELIEQVLQVTDLVNKMCGMPHAQMRIANFHLLQIYAYAISGQGNLRSWLYFVDKLQESGSDFKPASLSDTGNRVRVMTIHGAKGLEMPVCIVANLSSVFSDQDKKGQVLLSPQTGLSFVRRRENNQYHSTMFHEAARLQIKQEIRSEEMRILYVALTRARQKLILSICSKESEWSDVINRAYNRTLSVEDLLSCNSYGDILLTALLYHPSSDFITTHSGLIPKWNKEAEGNFCFVKCTPQMAQPVKQQQEDTFCTDKVNPQLVEQIKKTIDYKYPHQQAVYTKTKVSVTSLTKSGYVSIKKQPEFANRQGLSGMQRGTALHKFMQYCNFNTAATDAKDEIQRMKQQQYLSPVEADSIDEEAVNTFFSGEMGQMISKAAKIYRELKFFSYGKESEEGVCLCKKGEEGFLIQGIADCVLDMGNYMVLIDYKTDYCTNKDQLINRYLPQLALYQQGLAQLFDKPIKKVLIYSFSLGQVIDTKIV